MLTEQTKPRLLKLKEEMLFNIKLQMRLIFTFEFMESNKAITLSQLQMELLQFYKMEWPNTCKYQDAKQPNSHAITLSRMLQKLKNMRFITAWHKQMLRIH